MVVVGGRHSANTKELTRLCAIAGTPALQIENAGTSWTRRAFEGVRIVGVTGGTSTPIEDLRDVAEHIFAIAGTPDRRARAAELARAALDQRPRRPAGPPRCRPCPFPPAWPDR